MTLDATMSGENANSYVTRAYANTYFADHYVADKVALWDTFTDSQKDLLLIHATIFGLENIVCVGKRQDLSLGELEYIPNVGVGIFYLDSSTPIPYSAYQALQFPRNVDISSNGTIFIPEDVKVAQCEQAIHLAGQDEEVLQNSFNGLKSESISIATIKFSQDFDTNRQTSSISPTVFQLLKKYTLKGMFGTNKVYRG